MYRESIEKPKEFFAKMALENLDWFEKFSSVHNESFSDTKWFEGGKINVAHNCIDRHLKTNPEKDSLIWKVMIQIRAKKSPIKNCMKKFAG